MAHDRPYPPAAGHAVMLRTLAAAIALLPWVTDATAAGAAPRVVVQLGHQAPVHAVIWTPDSRHLLSLADDWSIVIWDVASGIVIDRAQITPLDVGRDIPAILGLVVSQDGLSARLTFAANKGCPPAATGIDGLCSYDLDLRSSAVVPVKSASPSSISRTERFPLSPDGRWRPEPNYGSGVNGLPNRSDDNFPFTESDCTSFVLCRYGVNLFSTGGSPTKVALTGIPRSYFEDAEVTRDGRRLLRLESIKRNTAARVQVLDILDAASSSTVFPMGAYHRIRHLEGERYALFSEGYVATNDLVEKNAPAPVVIVDQVCSPSAALGSCQRVPPHGLMRALDNGRSFVGTGSIENCYRNGRDRLGGDGVVCTGGVDDDEDGQRHWRQLEFFQPGPGPRAPARWVPRAVPELAGHFITAIEVGPDGHTIAVAGRSISPPARPVVVVLDAAPGIRPRVLWTAPAPSEPVDYLTFDPDGRQLLFGFNGQLVVADLSGKRPARSLPFDGQVISDGVRAFSLENRQLFNLETGKAIATVSSTAKLIRAGFIDGKPVLWAASIDGVVQFWNSATGADLLTLYSFSDNKFVAATPEGRYDTNLGPDATQVRWQMSDAPWQSFAAQTFMRDYYEPRLVARVIACTAADSCATEFPPLRPLDQVNRVLPQVQVSSVVPGAAPGTVDVCVTAQGAATQSGLHDLRLFRDGRLIAEHGAAPPDLDPADFAQWAMSTAIQDRTCPDAGSVFTVAVPQDSSQPVTFTAYAFNSDRVKGDTSQAVSYLPPKRATPRTPRAYVIAVGVNEYVNIPEKALQFAVNDARAVGKALRSIPGHDVVIIELTSEHGRNQATKAQIRAVLALLAGERTSENGALLQAAGIDAGSLARSTPDDVVIITFSGHGVADPRGRFFLLPSDSAWPTGNETPDWTTMISSAELSEWLRAVDARDIGMVIDACHSAASVVAGQFKPGPMGDPGLGQLAYDKGMRILAATQGDDVALEDERLRQGLLTFALTGNDEALGKGDRVTLDDWLRYGARRIPSLAEDVRIGRLTNGAGGARGFTFLNATPAKKPQVQEPSLFDFTGQPSKVILKDARP